MKIETADRMKLVAAFVLATSTTLVSEQNAPIAQPAKVLAYADAIYYNGHVLTGENLAAGEARFVSALALREGEIVVAGSDDAAICLLYTSDAADEEDSV